MIVIGGTYSEFCTRPPHNTLMGSGLRAAGAVASVVPGVSLVSAVDDQNRAAAEACAAGLGVNATWDRRSGPTGFHYFTPLSPPTIYGGRETVGANLSATGDSVLAFGMLDARVAATGARIVLDPQNPRSLQDLPLDGIRAGELAVVLNRAEARRLTNCKDPRTGSTEILRKSGAVAVVTKLGAGGALVTEVGDQTHVGVYPTASVFPIGTGDIFAAGFTWAWASMRLPAVLAAQVGSAFAARWASTKSLPIPKQAVDDIQSGTALLAEREPLVYLAGPFFSLPQRWLVELARESLIGIGARCFSPLHDVGPGETEVAKADLEGLAGSNAVLVLADEYDPGTMFEVGWAIDRGIPVVAYVSPADDEKSKMMRGSGVELYDDFSTAVYRAVWRGMGAPPLR